MSFTDDQFAQLTNHITGMQGQIISMQTDINKLDRGQLKIFKYMTGRFDTLEKKLDDKADKSTADLIYNQLDGFLQRTDTDETERAALIAKVDRHEGWIQKIAESTDDDLQY